MILELHDRHIGTAIAALGQIRISHTGGIAHPACEDCGAAPTGRATDSWGYRWIWRIERREGKRRPYHRQPGEPYACAVCPECWSKIDAKRHDPWSRDFRS